MPRTYYDDDGNRFSVRRAPPPKRQFSKCHVIFADALAAFVWICYVALAFLDKIPPDYNVGVAIITIYGAFATGGYFTLCGVRDNSLNKYVNRKFENETEAAND